MGDSIWLAEELEESNEDIFYYGFSNVPLEELEDEEAIVQRRASCADYSNIPGFFR